MVPLSKLNIFVIIFVSIYFLYIIDLFVNAIIVGMWKWRIDWSAQILMMTRTLPPHIGLVDQGRKIIDPLTYLLPMKVNRLVLALSLLLKLVVDEGLLL